MSPTAIIQAVVGALLAGLLFFGGRSCGKTGSANDLIAANRQISQKNEALLTAATKLRDAAGALHQVNTIAAQEEAAAAERTRQADFAKERALIAADDFRRSKERVEAELVEAKRDPACRQELEKPICAALH